MTPQKSTCLGLILTCVMSLQIHLCQAQIEKLYTFRPNTSLGSPPTSVIFYENVLFGTATGGGDKNLGVIFKVNADGTNYTKLLDFTGANGAIPAERLICDGTFLYGMTTNGGAHNSGVVFRIRLDGTGYTKLIDFGAGNDGTKPLGELIHDGNFLYGMTSEGGANNLGIVFKVRPDGSEYSKLLDFSGQLNGAYPYGGLLKEGDFLYGMTSMGGTNNEGVIFKLKNDGTSFIKLFDFSYTSGARPGKGSLVSDGTFLYGVTKYGGNGNSAGVIFKIKTDGTEFSKLFDFMRYRIDPGLPIFASPDGQNPEGTLTLVGSVLYGVTPFGGWSSYGDADGVIFKINTNGTGFMRLRSFYSGEIRPGVSLTNNGSDFYGVTTLSSTTSPETTSNGAIFTIKSDGSGYTKIFDQFNNDIFTGDGPTGALISDGTFLYGTTARGGKYWTESTGKGVIFKLQIDGSGYEMLHAFQGPDGKSPQGALLSVGDYLYGATLYGGTNDKGVLYRIRPDGTGFNIIMNFDGATGSHPLGSMISDGNYLFGSTTDISGSDAITFKIKDDGTEYSQLLDFPAINLIYTGNFLCGIKNTANTSEIFRVLPDGSGYSALLDVPNQETFEGSLLSDGTFLYVATTKGTTKIHIENGTLDAVTAVPVTPNGVAPSGHLFSDGTYFYGANGGTFYGVKYDGTGLSTLANSGYYGVTPLISEGGFLYGMATESYLSNYSEVFKFCPLATATSPIEGEAAVCAGNSQTYKVAELPGATNYIWTLPADWYGAAATNSITVTPGSSHGDISVSAKNFCGVTQPQVLSVKSFLDVPAQPGIIGIAKDTIIVCRNSLNYYGLSVAEDVLRYSWTLPDTWNLELNLGNGIIATCFDNGGDISVVGHNGCGPSIPRTFYASLPQKPTITVELNDNGTSLTSSPGDEYQWWVDGEIVGTTKTIVASKSGDYHVEVVSNGCPVEQSDPQSIIITGIEASKNFSVHLHPNPSEDFVTLSLNDFEKGKFVSIAILDINGKLMKEILTHGNETLYLDISCYSPGKYLVIGSQGALRVSASFIKK